MGALLSSEKKKKKKKKGKGVSEADRAILDLKNARDRLRKYEGKLEHENAELTTQARELLRVGKRDRAALLVKLKRYRTTRIGEINDQLLKLEEMVQTIEWETQQTAVVDALRAGNDALNALHSIMTLESVEQLMDETREAMDKERQLSNLLADAPSRLTDDDAVLDEFKALEAAMEQDAPPIDLPEAPNTALPEPQPQAKPASQPVARVAVPA